MKCDEGLALAGRHMIETLGNLGNIGLRDGWDHIVHSAILMRWDIPTGGCINLSFGFEVKHVGAQPQAILVPSSQISCSLASHLEQSTVFVDVLNVVVAAAKRALLLMQQHEYEV